MLLEEGEHRVPAVLGGGLVVPDRQWRWHAGQPPLPAVDLGEERMPGAIVGLDVVGHAQRSEMALESLRHAAPEDHVSGAIAGHDRADALQRLAAAGDLAIVDGGSAEAGVRSSDQREPPALAEAGDRRPFGVDLRKFRQSVAHGQDVRDLAAHCASQHVDDHAGQADQPRAV